MASVNIHLGPPANGALSHQLFGLGGPTKINYQKKVGTLVLTSLLEDLEIGHHQEVARGFQSMFPFARVLWVPIFVDPQPSQKISYPPPQKKKTEKKRNNMGFGFLLISDQPKGVSPKDMSLFGVGISFVGGS